MGASIVILQRKSTNFLDAAASFIVEAPFGTPALLSFLEGIKSMVFFALFFFLSFSFTAYSSETVQFSVQPLPEYDALFDRTDGWTGADGAFTVALDATTTLWLFSDTWVGKIRDGKHVESTMINNSVARQCGFDPRSAAVEFFYKTKEGKPASLIEPADGRGWFWLFAGTMTGKSLNLFLKQIVKTSDDVFGFRHAATWLGHVENPFDRPTDWKIAQTKIPWDRSDKNGNLEFGAAALKENGFVYIYGAKEEKREGWLHRFLILARAPEETLGDFSSWRFYRKSNWTDDFTQAERLCDKIGSEFSVSYQRERNKYLLLTTENGMSEKIQIRTADKPWGTWSDPVTVFTCPDGKGDSSYFTYAGKAHPMLSAPNELIFTYVCNSFDFGKMVSDSRIYHPRFARIRFDASSGLQNGNGK